MATSPPDDDPRVQYNVRLPRSIRDRVDERRRVLGLSRDQWTAKALLHVLDNTAPPDTGDNTP